MSGPVLENFCTIVSHLIDTNTNECVSPMYWTKLYQAPFTNESSKGTHHIYSPFHKSLALNLKVYIHLWSLCSRRI